LTDQREVDSNETIALRAVNDMPVVEQEVLAEDDTFSTTIPEFAMNENTIYGLVDSIRELSLSVSFFTVGVIFDTNEREWASRICCGVIPLAALGMCAALPLYFPYIVLSDGRHSISVK
jgi:hypothetical protein